MRVYKDACKCGANNWSWWRKRYPNKLDSFEFCSECSTETMPSLSPDVYFDSRKGSWQKDPNLCDIKTGEPIPFSSKREKAAIMQRLGVKEAGDKKHGARNWDRAASRQWDNI